MKLDFWKEYTLYQQLLGYSNQWTGADGEKKLVPSLFGKSDHLSRSRRLEIQVVTAQIPHTRAYYDT